VSVSEGKLVASHFAGYHDETFGYDSNRLKALGTVQYVQNRLCIHEVWSESCN
jgi:hypothetical protein